MNRARMMCVAKRPIKGRGNSKPISARLERRDVYLQRRAWVVVGSFVVLSSTVQNTTHIINFTEITEEGHQIRQLCIVWVIEPRRDRDCIIWMEDVRCRGVVENNGIRYWTTQLGKIL